MTEEPRREHARVVQDQQIATTEMRRQTIERRVLGALPSTIEHDESRAATLGWRVLSDQLLGEMEIEIADVHDPKKRPRLVRPRLASRSFHRSPTFAIRWRTLSSLKSSIFAPRSTSFQVSGVDTVASGLGLTE